MPESKPVYIYRLVDPETNETRYIGKTVQPEKRLWFHLFHAKHGKDSHKDRWIRQLLAKDVEPLFEVIEVCDQAIWQERERFWIAYHKENGSPLTNTSAGGQAIDCPRTDEWRKRISEALKGRKKSPQQVEQMREMGKRKWKDTCSHGHKRTPENTTYIIRDGHELRICKACQRISQERMRRNRGIPRKGENPVREFCKQGHALSGDNLRLLRRVRNGHEYIERICRTCVRERNRECKYRRIKRHRIELDARLCRLCKNSLPEGAASSRLYCDACAEKRRQETHADAVKRFCDRKHAERMAKGCIDCGGELPSQKARYCATCREKHRRINEANYSRKCSERMRVS